MCTDSGDLQPWVLCFSFPPGTVDKSFHIFELQFWVCLVGFFFGKIIGFGNDYFLNSL